jgi:hypothetical protein
MTEGAEETATDDVTAAAPIPGASGSAVRRWPLRRPSWLLVIASLVGIAVIWVLVAYKSPPEIDVRAADIPRAVAALEGRIGRNQRYTEINATADGVNLFVVQPDGQERAWFFANGTIEGPGTAAPAQAKAFALDGVDLSLALKIARGVVEQFPGSRLAGFALVDQQGRLIWSARAVSSRGGTIEAYFTTDGQTLGGSLK